MPGLSREEAVYARPGPQALCPLARSGAAESPRLGPNPGDARSRRERKRSKPLFSELKLRLGLRRVRLRRLWNVAEQFYLAASAQNLKRLVKVLSPPQPLSAGCC